MATEHPRLEDWAAFPRGGDQLYLTGTVFGHRFRTDGHIIQTSHVVAAGAGLARTASGTTYRLGRPATSYREMREERGDWDAGEPLRVGEAP